MTANDAAERLRAFLKRHKTAEGLDLDEALATERRAGQDEALAFVAATNTDLAILARHYLDAEAER
jgi:hypothetical protein